MTAERYTVMVGLIALLLLLGIGAVAYSVSKADDAFKKDCRQAGGVPIINRVRTCYASNAVIEIK